MANSHNPLNRDVGELEDRKYRDEFFSDTATGFISGPAVETEFVTPSFEAGEVWDLRIQISFSSEPGPTVLRLMNEAEDEVIVRTVIDGFEGNHFELRAVVTDDDVGTSGSRSPDLQIEFLESDTSNYFVTCRGIRLRRPSKTDPFGEEGTTEGFDARNE